MTSLSPMRMGDMWAYVGTLVGVLAFGQTLLNSLLPPELRAMLGQLASRVADWLSAYAYVDIPEYDGVSYNELYGAIKLHLSGVCAHSVRRINLTRALNSGTLTYSAANNERVAEDFGGATFQWEHQAAPRPSPSPYYLSTSAAWRTPPADETRVYVLRVRKRDKNQTLLAYLDRITEHAKEIRLLSRDRLLYTNSKGLSWDSRTQPWESVPFNHPSTFQTLALDPIRKQHIMADLTSFASGEHFYQKTGRAWKRGYLLYGPPGTGKSSMIAAMANYLGYDVYDLELTEVHTNADLRKLLIRTTNKSIIVIEDIDCSLNLTNRTKRPSKKEPKLCDPSLGGGKPEEQSNCMTLSGLLNFTDGLWSCCGSERIFVFTTNHIERLDPALLRCGRMDMRIYMPFCSFSAFKILAKNYLGIDDHFLLEEVEEIVDDAHITPADVSEILIRNRGDPKAALEDLLTEMREAKEKPWPPPINDEDSIEDAEEEKRALEEEKPWKGDWGKSAAAATNKCTCCEKAIKFEEQLQDMELIKKAEEKEDGCIEAPPKKAAQEEAC